MSALSPNAYQTPAATPVAAAAAAAAGATLGSFLIALLHFLMELMLFQTMGLKTALQPMIVAGAHACAAALCLCCVCSLPRWAAA
jgi:hypothetical protein